MTFLDELPAAVAHLIRTHFIVQFGTVSAAGVPIDTTMTPFMSADLRTIDMGTGLAYPAKAERARRNPKVGLLFDRGADEPVVSIAGMAAVRDADLQANCERYAAEEILIPLIDPKRVDYETVTRHAVWYFTRILICVTPVCVRWWKNRAAMDETPDEWRAPADSEYPASDPLEPDTRKHQREWPQPPWHELVRRAFERNAPAHLTLLDEEGFPLPMPISAVLVDAEGFRFRVPRAAPWQRGKATLTFEGIETFIGEASVAEGEGRLQFERALPVLPLMADSSEVLHPKPETKARLMQSLEYEARRRGQSLPTVPPHPPEPTAGAKLRAAARGLLSG
jgi:hypothetical protein